ncbi:MAG: hypothetical protein LBR25_10360 [Erysipelotrichaceae bacterium]|nr:hypothetical protein [Erysipelotrichaceae bacterium]
MSQTDRIDSSDNTNRELTLGSHLSGLLLSSGLLALIILILFRLSQTWRRYLPVFDFCLFMCAFLVFCVRYFYNNLRRAREFAMNQKLLAYFKYNTAAAGKPEEAAGASDKKDPYQDSGMGGHIFGLIIGSLFSVFFFVMLMNILADLAQAMQVFVIYSFILSLLLALIRYCYRNIKIAKTMVEVRNEVAKLRELEQKNNSSNIGNLKVNLRQPTIPVTGYRFQHISNPFFNLLFCAFMLLLLGYFVLSMLSVSPLFGFLLLVAGGFLCRYPIQAMKKSYNELIHIPDIIARYQNVESQIVDGSDTEALFGSYAVLNPARENPAPVPSAAIIRKPVIKEPEPETRIRWYPQPGDKKQPVNKLLLAAIFVNLLFVFLMTLFDILYYLEPTPFFLIWLVCDLVLAILYLRQYVKREADN